jgi:hypothetical protein
MGDASLGLNMTVGADAVQVIQKKNAKASLAQGVPVHVNPTKMTNEMGATSMELPNMKVGGNTVSAAQKQGVPVLVTPVLMVDTMHSASLALNMVVGPDEIALKKKQQLAQGVPVHVNPTKMTNEMGATSMELPNMKVGGNTVSAAQKTGVPVLVTPVLMVDTMHDATLGMNMVVGPDEIALKKKQMQTLVQQISTHSKYTDMKEADLEEIIKAQILAGVKVAPTPAEAKKTLDDMKAAEEAMGKRILDRLAGSGWSYGYPLYPYVPYGSPYWYDAAGLINSIYSY